MDNKSTLLVIGASSEIASQYINIYHHKYSSILLHYNNHKPVLNKIPDSTSISFFQSDLSDHKSTQNLLTDIRKSEKQISHLLFCAAPEYGLRPFSKTEWSSHYQNQIDIQLRTAVLISKQLLPNMVEKKRGKIVFLLSSILQNPPAGCSDYLVAKHALLGLMLAMSTEFSKHHICINGVSPSMVNTKFIKKIPDFVKDSVAEASPLKRLSTCNDVIPTIDFLMSDISNFITGQNIFVTGGKP